MKLLCFQAKRFRWQTFAKTLEEVEDLDIDDTHLDCVVVFAHVEAGDEGDARPRVFRHALKHIKWLANKREFKNVVLHSFTHLGGTNADAAFAQELLLELAERLRETGYVVKCTPFGYFCAWDLEVHGASLAKVWKEI